MSPKHRFGAGMEQPETPEQAQEAKPEFAVDKWNYTREGVAQFIQKVSHGDKAIAENLTKSLSEQGGKAFGLKICEIIGKNFKYFPHKLYIPRWEMVKDMNTIKPEEWRRRMVLRSSALDEDWLDTRSGVYPSFDPNDYFEMLKLEHMQKSKKIPKVPFIKQEESHGCGLVINVGYSSLLKKVVMKIASGRVENNNRFFTSATEDTEAGVGVWEAETGDPVLPTRNFNHSLYPDGEKFRHVLAKPLLKALQDTGIDFGVQMEAVVHPEESFGMDLVQIRPMPSKIFQQIKIGKQRTETKNRASEKLLAESAMVNGAFDFSGEATLFGREGVSANSNAFHFSSYEKLPIRKGKGGKIGMYERAWSTEGQLGRPAGILTYFGGYLNGYDVQLTCFPIKANDHHGIMEINPEFFPLYSNLDEHCGMVSLTPKQIETIEDLAKKNKDKKPLKLRVVSDGLVARVYTSED